MRNLKLRRSKASEATAQPADGIEFCFDSPVQWDVPAQPLRVEFRGWVIAAGNDEVGVVVTDEEGSRSVYELTVDRPDVVAHFAAAGREVPLRCGFGFTVELPEAPGPEFRLAVEVRAGSERSEPIEFRAVSFRSMQWPSVDEESLAETQRGDYKSTWQAVSTNEDEAKISVAGTTDEQGFEAAAQLTLEILERSVGVQPDDEILEIGCGVGRMAQPLSARCARWTGADVSENMLSFARQRTAGLDNVDFVALNGWDLSPIADESLDLVYCTVVFMHLDEWERFNYICESMRVLRPGGRVFVDNYNLLSEEGWDFFMKNMLDYHPLRRPPNISKSSTHHELRRFLAKAGFVDIDHLEDDSQFVYAWGRKPS